MPNYALPLQTGAFLVDEYQRNFNIISSRTASLPSSVRHLLLLSLRLLVLLLPLLRLFLLLYSRPAALKIEQRICKEKITPT